MQYMQITLTGTGTSFGMPVIACSCPRCLSTDTRDTRWRASAHIQCDDGTSIIIDAGPEFRLQTIKHHITKLDGMLITHSHADHLHGLDDVRSFSHTCTSSGRETPGEGLRIYTSTRTIKDIKSRFSYIFQETQLGGGKPKLQLVESDLFSTGNPITIGSVKCAPVPMMHGELPVTGWLLTEKGQETSVSKDGFRRSLAYLTDCSFIADSSIELVKDVEFLVIDGLRVRPHATHFSFDEALECSRRIHAKHTYFTHICHDLSHVEIIDYLNSKQREQDIEQKITVEPAYDGLVINV